MSAVQPQDKRLAEAVTVLIEAIHREVPAASMRSLAPYDDEDFTLEVRIPAGMDRDTVMDLCLRHALAVEDQFGFLILTRVKPAAVTETITWAARVLAWQRTLAAVAQGAAVTGPPTAAGTTDRWRERVCVGRAGAARQVGVGGRCRPGA